MTNLRPYRLMLLLNPKSSRDERDAVQTLVKTWVQEHHGSVHSLHEEEGRKLAYAIAHQAQAAQLRASFAISPESAKEMVERLRLERCVIRTRVWRGQPPSGKRVKDVPVKKPEAAPAPEKKPSPGKAKVPLEKLEEKIEEILEKEVL